MESHKEPKIYMEERESGWETEAIFSPILMLHKMMWSFYRIRERLLKIR